MKMSAKYHHLLITTCVSALAISIAMPSQTHAGFEWTPPVKKEVEVVAEEPVPAVPTPDVEEEELFPVEEEAPIEIKVLDEDPLPVAEDVPMETEEKAAVTEIVEEEITEIPQEIIEDDTLVSEVSEEIEIVEEEVVLDSEITPIEEEQAPDENTLTINPFPVADETPTSVPEDENNVVYLSADEDAVSDEVVVSDTAGEMKKEATTKEEIFWNESPTFDVIEGFGSDMALALVLRQVVPANYAFSFGKGVNPGEILSWEGGAPWNEVLANALAPVGYTFSIKGTKLAVSKTADAAPVVAEEAEESNAVEDIIEEITESEETVSEDPTPLALQDEDLEVVIDTDTQSSAIDESILEDVIEEEVSVDSSEHEQENVVSEPAPVIEIIEEQDVTKGTVEEADPTPETDTPAEVSEEPVAPEEGESESTEEPTLKRNVVLDPGTEETTQPEANMLSDEKKKVEDSDISLSDAVANGGIAIHSPAANGTQASDDLTVVEIPAVTEIIEAQDASVDVLPLNDISGADDIVSEASDISSIITEGESAEQNITQIAENFPAEETEIAPQAPLEPAEPIDLQSDAVAVEQPEEPVTNAPTASSPSNATLVWEGRKGRDLYKVLTAWSEEENIELVWMPEDKDIELSSNIFINGTFKNAVDVLFSKGVKNAPAYEITLDPYQLIIR